MRLGLVTDVHSHSTELARALALFHQRGVDQVVTLGDTIDAFARSSGAAEVAELLLEANAIGVWGNHDCTLRGEISDTVRARFPEVCLTFMARMQPRLIIEDCHFSHREASVDPHDVLQLWEMSEDRLDLVKLASLGFDAVPQRWQFLGHYHRWWAATSDGQAVWQGGEPLVFEPQERYFVVVGPVFQGLCAILDLDRSMLEPLRCGV